MPRITTRPTSTSSAVAVFCDRVRIGYLTPRDDGWWLWEFCMRSEALNCAPRGAAESRELAVSHVSRCFAGWLAAAGLPAPDLECAYG